MFVTLDVYVRQGADRPPVVREEVVRIDLIQRMREIEVTDIEGPCVELLLDNEERLQCRATLADLKQAFEE